MPDLPEVGLSAVIENLKQFTAASDKIVVSYDKMNEAGDVVEKGSFSLSAGLTGVASVLSTVLVAAASAAVAAIGGVATAIGLVGKAAFDMASDVDSATNNIQVSLGATEEEAEKLGKIATDIWANNFGESVNEVSDALVLAKRRFEEVNDVELQNITEGGFMIQDAFGVDMEKSLAAVDTLMTNFGLTSTEALDFVTKGFQKGLDNSGDFIETITEFSALWADGEGSAEQFFSTLETGYGEGILGTNKIADAFKEFQIRFVEGNDDLQEGLGTIGLDYDDLRKQVESGSITMVDVFGMVTDAAGGIDSQSLAGREALGKLGTQFEDLGIIVGQVDIGATKLSELEGATEGLNKQYDNIGDLFQDIWRDALVALLPLGDALLETGKEIMPLLQEAITAIQPSIEEFAQFLGTELTKAAQELIPWIQERLVPILMEISQWIINEGIPNLVKFANWIWNELIPAIKEWYKWFKENIWPIILQVADTIKEDVIPAIGDFVSWVTDELIPALKEMWKWFDKNILPVVDEVFKLFSKDGKKAGKTMSKIWKDIEKAMEPVVEEVFPLLLDLWDTILKWTKKNWPLIKRTIQTVLKAIQKRVEKVLDFIEKFWEDWGETLLGIAKRVFGLIFRTIKRNLENILDIITLVMQIITGDWEGAWETILRIAERILDQIKDVISTAFKNFKDVALNALKLMIGDVATKFTELKTKITEKLNEIKASIAAIWSSIKQATVNAIRSMMQSIVSTIGSFASTITNKLRTVVSNAVSGLLTAVTSGSIFTTLQNIGKQIITVIANAMTAGAELANKLRQALADGVQQVIDNLGTLGTKLKSIATEMISSISKALLGLWISIRDSIRTALNVAVSGVMTGATTLLSSIKSIGSKIVTNIGNSISSNFFKIKSKLKEVVEDLVKEALDWLGIGSPSQRTFALGVDMAKGLALGLQDGSSLIASGLGNLISAPLIPAPVSGMGAAGSQSITHQTFNLGENNISSGMDQAEFDARVMDSIRRNTG